MWLVPWTVQLVHVSIRMKLANDVHVEHKAYAYSKAHELGGYHLLCSQEQACTQVDAFNLLCCIPSKVPDILPGRLESLSKGRTYIGTSLYRRSMLTCSIGTLNNLPVEMGICQLDATWMSSELDGGTWLGV